MMRRLSHAAGVLLFFAGLTVALTWPQASYLRTHVPWFDDALLSIWRISWIAHALRSAVPLADANIFHPEVRTLAYTDAVLLQGLISAPFITRGVSPVLVYNLLILGSIALSGAAMYALAKRLTGSPAGGLVAGTIFAFVSFRFDHYQHLELQATVFMPLALWFLDRAFERPRWSDMAGFGACVLLQLLSGIYYTVFLATALAIVIPVRWFGLSPAARTQFATRLVAVAAVCALATMPYLSIYLQNRTSVGERDPGEIGFYSATPLNFFSSDPFNVLHGTWGAGLGRSERRLFPGFAALVLAGIGLRRWSPRKTSIAIIGGVGVVIAMGVNTPIYGWLRDLVFTYRGLRAPARAAILVILAVALLAAYGWAAVIARWPKSRVVGTGLVLSVLLLEYLTIPTGWLIIPRQPPVFAQWLARQPRTVVVELPLPKPDALHTIYDGFYMYGSTFHWQPMLNGYSGFYPRSYLELLERTRDFPEEAALDYLKTRGVDLIVLHGRFMKPDELGDWAATLVARPDVEQVAQFPEQGGDDMVFRLLRPGTVP